jgi:hypothetical protein
MTKKLQVDNITSELQGSVFFPSRAQETTPEPPQEPEVVQEPQPVELPHTADQPVQQPRPRRSAKAEQESKLDSKRASKHASTQAVLSDSQIESIRKLVKTPGKEVSYVRLTPQEKDELAEILYTYKRRGTKTTENEITRIAVNYLVVDYKENGDASVLSRVISALRA